MSAVVSDTLKFARSLRLKAKLSREQAEGFAEAIADAVQEGRQLPIRSEFSQERRLGELRVDADVAEMRSGRLKWMLCVVMCLQAAVIIGGVVVLTRAIRP